MLYSIILGNQQKGILNSWEVLKDEYDNSYVANDSIKQRLRLGKNVPKHLNVDYSCANVAAFKFGDEPETEMDTSYADVKAYKLPNKTFVSNNDKNMNLALLNFFSKEKEVMEAHEDDNIVYITMMTDNYELVDYYTLNANIIQTYRKREAYQGCVLSFKDSQIGAENGTIAVLYVKDTRKNRFIGIRIAVNVTDEGKTRINVTKEGVEKKVLKNLFKEHKKIKAQKRQVQFKIQVDPGKLLTRFYVTLESKRPELESILADKGIKNIMIFEIPDKWVVKGKMKDQYMNDEGMNIALTEAILDKRIRSITTYKVGLPKSFCKDYNIMYLFDYDEKSDAITCLKSN